MNLLTEHLATWIAADTAEKSARGRSAAASLYGVKKLRELILELAVRGLLVPQDHDDEPASELLKKIAAEKAKLVKEGKIKAQKPLPPIGDDEKPFELPKGWEWVRLGSLGVCSTGSTPNTQNSAFYGVDIPFIGPAQITPNNVLLSADKWLSEHGRRETTIANSGDILMVCIGGSIGKSAITDMEVSFNQQINCISPILAFSNYIHFSMQSPHFQMSILDAATGSATPIINRTKWENLLIAISPLAEQQRIVTKVDELMALCDQLEKQQNNSQTAHQHLVSQLLNALTSPKSVRPELVEGLSGSTGSPRTEKYQTSPVRPELVVVRQAHHERLDNVASVHPELVEGMLVEGEDDFQHTWQRIASHFDVLFTTEDSINQLKQSILQLAVMGKLVPQNPNDEPASQLLKKIAAEKAHLVKEGKIKAQKPLPPIGNDEKAFELPKGWEWVRLGSVSVVLSGNAFRSEDFNTESGVRVIKITNAGVGEIVETNDFLPSEFSTIHSSYLVNKDDLILALTRPYIADGLKISKCPISYHNSLLNQRVASIRFDECIYNDYGFLFLRSKFVLDLYQGRFSGSGLQPNLKISDVTELVLSIPPLAEQQRIVTKVDELMALCDQLKNQLNQAKHLQGKIADVLVEQALA